MDAPSRCREHGRDDAGWAREFFRWQLCIIFEAIEIEKYKYIIMSTVQLAPTLSLSQITEDFLSPYVLTARSRQVCAMEGILPEELFHLPKNHFADKDLPDKICEIRWNHYERTRREKLKTVKRVYKQATQLSATSVVDASMADFSNAELANQQSSERTSSKNKSENFDLAKQIESLAQRQKRHVSKLLFDEIYWQIQFENSIKTGSDDVVHSEHSVRYNSQASNIRKEKIMLASHREAERARRATEMRAIMEQRQEERKLEVQKLAFARRRSFC